MVTASPPPGSSPLDAEQLRELESARARRRKIRRAAWVAGLSGWTTAVFAGFSLLGGLFSLTSLIAGAGLALIAWGEFRGARMLRAIDRRGPSRLALNQLALFALICCYSAWGLYAALTRPSSFESQETGDAAVDAMLAETMAPYEDLVQAASIGLYLSLIPIGLIVQGSTAWYYASRARHLRVYREQTPPWVLEVDRLAQAA